MGAGSACWDRRRPVGTPGETTLRCAATGSSIPRPANPVRPSSLAKKVSPRRGVARSVHITSALRPGSFAGRPHLPHRHRIVRLPRGGVDQATTPVEKSALICASTDFEQIVDAPEVFVSRVANDRRPAGRQIGRDDALRQVAVDVGIHARERELNRQDPRTVAAFEKRPPCRRRPGRIDVRRRRPRRNRDWQISHRAVRGRPDRETSASSRRDRPSA